MHTKYRRRQAMGIMLSGAALGVSHILSATTDHRSQAMKALLFDVFGTVVDWRGSIIAEGTALNQRKGLTIDWSQFADDWRAGYVPHMLKVRRGELPWTNIDGLHRMILESLRSKYDLSSFSEPELEHLNKVWHRLKPWPDTVNGLTRLKSKFLIATLSNGNVSLLANMAKNARLPWDVVLSAELFKTYKPDLTVYQSAAKLLGLTTKEVMMVAAHASDLQAAQEAGLKTAYVHRPFERGPGDDGKGHRQPAENLKNFDYIAENFNDLADQLHAD